MKIYKTQAEIEADIVDGVLTVNEDVKFECSFSINASLKIEGDIDAWDIDAWDIDAGDIDAWDINAWNINALDISFWAVCFAYNSFKCKSIAGRRDNAKYFCLDKEVEISK